MLCGATLYEKGKDLDTGYEQKIENTGSFTIFLLKTSYNSYKIYKNTSKTTKWILKIV